VGDAPAPSLAFRLEPPHPNPVSSRATIRFALPQAAPVTLALYDVLGRRLAVLVDGPRTAGLHSVPLDRAVFRNGVGGGAGGRGASFAGQALPGGVYFLKLDALGAVRVQKLQVMP
jgi:hypothetical protein